jgi:hypothetical protein
LGYSGGRGKRESNKFKYRAWETGDITAENVAIVFQNGEAKELNSLGQEDRESMKHSGLDTADLKSLLDSTGELANSQVNTWGVWRLGERPMSGCSRESRWFLRG